jgi:hypothetical protein
MRREGVKQVAKTGDEGSNEVLKVVNGEREDT